MEERTRKYWNNKYPKQDIVYAGRAIRGQNDRIPIDVRTMIAPKDCLLKEVIQTNNLKKSRNDDTAWEIQKYIVNNYKYVDDKKSAGIEEFWQLPNETLYTKRGDCEDCSILMASLLLNAGIPSWRVRVTAGMVKPDTNAPGGGHAYCTLCREVDNNWVVLDWCYYQDSHIEVDRKPLFKNLTTYKEVWFSFNNEFAWSHKTWDVFEGIK